MSTKRIFITGATGYIGGSIAARLVEKGYQVTGLARKEADLSRLQALGITPVQGTIDAVQLIADQATAADAVINAANADNPYVVATLLQALENTGKILIHTSGSSIVGDKAAGQHAPAKRYDNIPEHPLLEKLSRVAIDKAVLQAAQKGVHAIVICPTMIYSDGLGLKKESDQVPTLTRTARQYNAGVVIGKGANVWSNVHISDLADLYLLALEKAASGSFFFAENGEAELLSISRAISHQLRFNGQVRHLSLDEAIDLWGPGAAHYGLGSNSLVSADKARKTLGWKPVHNSLLETIREKSEA